MNKIISEKELFEAARTTIQKKNADYTAKSEDIFKNFSSSTAFGVQPVNGLQMRMMDKFQRICAMALNGKLEVSESAIDSCEDLVNYSVLMYCIILQESSIFPPMTLYDLLNIHNGITGSISISDSDILVAKSASVAGNAVICLVQECIKAIVSFNIGNFEGDEKLEKAKQLCEFIVEKIATIARII